MKVPLPKGEIMGEDISDIISKKKNVVEVIKQAEDNTNNINLKEVLQLLRSKIDSKIAENLLDKVLSDEAGKQDNPMAMLPFLLKLKQDGQINDQTFNMMLLATMGGGNSMLPLMLMMNNNGNGNNEEIRRLKRMIRHLKKKLESQPETQTEKQNPNDLTIQALVEIVKTVAQQNAPKEDETDKLLKMAEMLKSLQGKSATEQAKELAEIVKALREAGIYKDESDNKKLSLLEKKLEIQQELARQRMETEKELKTMELEKERQVAEAQKVMAEKQAESLRELAHFAGRGLVRGILEATKPVETQRQVAPPQPQPQPPQSPPQPRPQEPPKEEPKEEKPKVEMIAIAHMEGDKELHRFELPETVVTQNSINHNGKTYYKVTCPYDGQDIYMEAG